MKRIFAFVFALIMLSLSFVSCGESELYGVWYRDDGNVRNLIQFAENSKGEDTFIWKILDTDNVSRLTGYYEETSSATGYYSVSGSTITLKYTSADTDVDMTYSINDDELSLMYQGTVLILNKYEE